MVGIKRTGKPESRGFVDFRSLQKQHRERLKTEFAAMAVPEIKKFEKAISRNSKPLSHRIPEAISAIKKFLEEHGVSAFQRIDALPFAEPVQVSTWLSYLLAEPTTLEIEKAMERRVAAANRASKKGKTYIGWVWENANFGLPNSERIAKKYHDAINPNEREYNLKDWKGEAKSYVDFFIRKELEKEK